MADVMVRAETYDHPGLVLYLFILLKFSHECAYSPWFPCIGQYKIVSFHCFFRSAVILNYLKSMDVDTLRSFYEKAQRYWSSKGEDLNALSLVQCKFLARELSKKGAHRLLVHSQP